ncbi:hypothetical protein CR513_01379, partial [Mucuna pruriens]
EDEGEASGISSSDRSLGGTRGFSLNETISNVIHSSVSSTKRSRVEFDVGNPVAVPQIHLPFVGELGRDFQARKLSNLYHVSQNTLLPELLYQHGNMGMEPNYGNGRVTSLGNGNYHIPTSNFTAQLHRRESSSTVQLFPTQKSCPQNPLGGVNGAPWFPTTQYWINNPNLHQPHSQLSTGLGAMTPDMMHSGRFRSFSFGGRSFNNESQFPNTQQQGRMANIQPISNPREMGESSSRNVKMKMTLADNNHQSAELQMGSMFSTQGNPRVMGNSLYDPMYEQMGLPVDPHLRYIVVQGLTRSVCYVYSCSQV